jgi:hypothetical protein
MESILNVNADWICDAGHAWLKVSKDMFNRTNRTIRHISSYSYQDDEFYYLEEDVDALNYINNLKDQNVSLRTREIDDGVISPVRNLERVAI